MLMDSMQPIPQTEMDALLLGRTKELTEVIERNGKNWRGILISFIVIVVICSLISTTVLVFSPEILIAKNFNNKELITLDEVINGKLIPKQFSGFFHNDKQLIYKDLENNLILSQINETNVYSKIIVSNITFNIHQIQKYFLSQDLNYMIYSTNIKKIYRYSTKGQYFFYNIKEDTKFPIKINQDGKHETDLNFVSWSPNSKYIVLSYKNDLYYKSSLNSDSIKFTLSNENVVYGLPDWLYEEEILSQDNAFYWSEDSSAFAYLAFNDSLVDKIIFPWYGNYEEDIYQYPSLIKINYPKTGRANPTTNIFIKFIDKKNGQLKQQTISIIPPDEVPKDNYFLSLIWINSSSLLVQWANRVQNKGYICLCEIFNQESIICKTNYIYKSNEQGWIDLSRFVPILDTTYETFFLQASSFQNEHHGSFMHIARINLNKNINYDKKKIKFLTSGLFEVTEIYFYDDLNNKIYYQATEEFLPFNRQVYKLDVITGINECLTCNLFSSCTYNSGIFSPEGTYWIFNCEGPNVPFSQLRTTKENFLINELESNSLLVQTLSKKLLPDIKIFTLPFGKYNYSIKMLLPPNLNYKQIAKYPMLINTYAGPGSQVVDNVFKAGWNYFLTTNKNIIYTKIDGRGSGYQGDSLLFELYQKLGTIEVQDQLDVAKRLTQLFSFIDPNKIAIWGWSYGGYASSMALIKDENNLLKCAISVAPVTNWLYYDSAYTERYMGLPTNKKNIKNYINSNILNKVNKTKSNRLMLIHGSADDNVHFQHSMLLIKELNKYNIVYKSQVYPDQNHSLQNVGRHFYKILTQYLIDCFDLDSSFNYSNVKQKRFKSTYSF